MSQRDSGYERRERDLYETPSWVTETLLTHLPPSLSIWEPAAGSGKMVSALEQGGHTVMASDIEVGQDFLTMIPFVGPDAIVTNPPYSHAVEFIEHALKLMWPFRGKVAMLLRTDFDHAATRQHLFGKLQAFSKKIVLTRRIVWFESEGAAPSFNHAWYLWDWRHNGPPVIAYAPEIKAAKYVQFDDPDIRAKLVAGGS